MSNAPSKPDVQGAIEAGFAFVCAMCARLHEGRKAAVNWEMTKCTGDGCTGPIGGQSYPKYAGPILYALSTFCCFCGTPHPEHMISSNREGNDKTRMLGVCSKHLHLVENREGFTAKRAGEHEPTKVNLFGHEVEL